MAAAGLRQRGPSVQAGHGTFTNGLTKALTQEEIDKLDPFTHYPQFTTFHKVLTYINTLWLVPLRLVFIVLPALFLGVASNMLALIGDHWDPKNPQPLGKWGNFVHRYISQSLARLMLFGFGFHWVHVKGKPAPSVPITVIGPHTSLLDAFAIGCFKTSTPVVRVEDKSTPLIGLCLERSLRAIFVDRENPNSREKTAEEMKCRAKSNGVWPTILISPEGVTSNRKVLLKFKLGAFLPGLPVQPVLLKFPTNPNTVTWAGNGIGWFGSFLLTGAQLHNSLEIEFLPVINPTQAEKENPRLFADRVQRIMAEALNLPIGNQRYEDMLLMLHAKSLGLPFPRGLVIYHIASRQTGLNVPQMKMYLTRFSVIDQDKDGYITVEDLAAFLNVPQDASLQAIFNGCRKDSQTEDGKVAFVDYLYGIVAVSRKLLENRQFLEDMFKHFDTDQDGRVSLEDITQSLPLPNSNRTPPAIMDPDHFKELLSEHLEYVVLFYVQQSSAISNPTLNAQLLDSLLVKRSRPATHSLNN